MCSWGGRDEAPAVLYPCNIFLKEGDTQASLRRVIARRGARRNAAQENYVIKSPSQLLSLLHADRVWSSNKNTSQKCLHIKWNAHAVQLNPATFNSKIHSSNEPSSLDPTPLDETRISFIQKIPVILFPCFHDIRNWKGLLNRRNMV